jgi:hypothetical protein
MPQVTVKKTPRQAGRGSSLTSGRLLYFAPCRCLVEQTSQRNHNGSHGQPVVRARFKRKESEADVGQPPNLAH